MAREHLVNRKTVYRGMAELISQDYPKDKSVRKSGGGRKPKLDQHPEWIDIFKEVVEPTKAGLPQDQDVFWTPVHRQ